jgi:hypothetical protein
MSTAASANWKNQHAPEHLAEEDTEDITANVAWSGL